MGYPTSWWRPQLRRLFDRLKLDRLFTLKSAMQWVHEGGGSNQIIEFCIPLPMVIHVHAVSCHIHGVSTKIMWSQRENKK